MKIIRAIGLAFALLTPAIALATPRLQSCCFGSCCFPGCPMCPHGK